MPGSEVVTGPPSRVGLPQILGPRTKLLRHQRDAAEHSCGTTVVLFVGVHRQAIDRDCKCSRHPTYFYRDPSEHQLFGHTRVRHRRRMQWPGRQRSPSQVPTTICAALTDASP